MLLSGRCSTFSGAISIHLNCMDMYCYVGYIGLCVARTGNDDRNSPIIRYLLVRSFVTFGKLRTSLVTFEKNRKLSNIFGHASDQFSKYRALTKKLTFGNPPSLAKRASSMIFDIFWEDRTWLNIFRNPTIIRQIEHLR